MTPSAAPENYTTLTGLTLLFDELRFSAAFRFLGRYSLEIYLVHTIATAGARVALNKLAYISVPRPILFSARWRAFIFQLDLP